MEKCWRNNNRSMSKVEVGLQLSSCRENSAKAEEFLLPVACEAESVLHTLPMKIENQKKFTKRMKFWSCVMILQSGLALSKLSEYCSKYHFWTRRNEYFPYLSDRRGFETVWNTLIYITISTYTSVCPYGGVRRRPSSVVTSHFRFLSCS